MDARMAIASKVSSVSCTTYDPPAAPPPGRLEPAPGGGCLAFCASWDRSTAPWRLKLDVLMPSILPRDPVLSKGTRGSLRETGLSAETSVAVRENLGGEVPSR